MASYFERDLEKRERENAFRALELTSVSRPSVADVKTAYRKLALRYHPDKVASSPLTPAASASSYTSTTTTGNNNNTNDRFLRIQEAYEFVLKDAKQRPGLYSSVTSATTGGSPLHPTPGSPSAAAEDRPPQAASTPTKATTTPNSKAPTPPSSRKNSFSNGSTGAAAAASSSYPDYGCGEPHTSTANSHHRVDHRMSKFEEEWAKKAADIKRQASEQWNRNKELNQRSQARAYHPSNPSMTTGATAASRAAARRVSQCLRTPMRRASAAADGGDGTAAASGTSSGDGVGASAASDSSSNPYRNQHQPSPTRTRRPSGSPQRCASPAPASPPAPAGGTGTSSPSPPPPSSGDDYYPGSVKKSDDTSSSSSASPTFSGPAGLEGGSVPRRAPPKVVPLKVGVTTTPPRTATPPRMTDAALYFRTPPPPAPSASSPSYVASSPSQSTGKGEKGLRRRPSLVAAAVPAEKSPAASGAQPVRRQSFRMASPVPVAFLRTPTAGSAAGASKSRLVPSSGTTSVDSPPAASASPADDPSQFRQFVDTIVACARSETIGRFHMVVEERCRRSQLAVERFEMVQREHVELMYSRFWGRLIARFVVERPTAKK